MQEASKKSGSVLFFEPLRVELNDCFGALKDVRPEVVFGSRSGFKKPDRDDDENSNDVDGAASVDAEASTSKTETPQKRTKCM